MTHQLYNTNQTNQRVPNIIQPGLRVLFCGINPGMMSATTGFHFARPGNKFWKSLYLSGLTTILLTPKDQHRLLEYGYGITNFVSRPSAKADELTTAELQEGTKVLIKTVQEYKPAWLVPLGIGPFRKGFNLPEANVGLQGITIDSTRIWLLPNPSGLNAHYRLNDFVSLFTAFRTKAGIPDMREHGMMKG